MQLMAKDVEWRDLELHVLFSIYETAGQVLWAEAHGHEQPPHDALACGLQARAEIERRITGY